MDQISNQLLGHIALFIGVVFGWILKGLWRSIRIRMKFKKIKLTNKDLEFIEFRKFCIKEIEKSYAYGLSFPIPVLWNHDKNKTIDAEYSDGKFRIVEK